MSDELLAALAQVDLPFSRARTPPREVYTDANWHARERGLLRDGFTAGSGAALPRPGGGKFEFGETVIYPQHTINCQIAILYKVL